MSYRAKENNLTRLFERWIAWRAQWINCLCRKQIIPKNLLVCWYRICSS